MADFFSGSLQSRAARGNFQSMAGSPAYESRYISFDEFIRSKGPEAAMRARDPIAFRGLWSEYSNRYPQSARIAVTQDAFRQMGGESPIEQGLRQAGDYQSYMQQMKAAGAEEFMLTPQSFAASDVRKREKGREKMQEFYKGRGTGEPVGDMSPDVPFKKKGAEAMVKVPVGPRGELQLDKAGQPATRFRTLPQSEVDRLKLEEARGREDIALQKMQPRVAELEARMGRAEKVEGQLGEEARKQSELAEFSRLLSENPIMSRPEYASKIKDGQALINAGSSAKDAMLYVEGRGGMLDVEQKKSIELIELRGKIAERAKAFGFTLDQAAAQIANTEKERVRQLAAEASSARDSASRERYRASFELQKRNTLLKIIDDIGARERLIASYRNQGKDEEIGLLEGDLEKLKQYRTEIEDLQINDLPDTGYSAPTQAEPLQSSYQGQPEGYQGERPRPGFVIVKTQYGEREVSQTQIAAIERALKAAGQQYEVIR